MLIRPAEPSAPGATRELLLQLIEAGARHLVLAPVPPWPPAPARWLADEIAEPVLAEFARGRPARS